MRSLRVLHVLGGTDRGGIETWLLRLMPVLNAQGVHSDIVVDSSDQGDYHAQFLALGCAIHPCARANHPWRYASRLGAIIAEHGPYDIVHAQLYLFNGLILKVAHAKGVPMRIAHLHPTSDVKAHRPGRRAYAWLMARWIARHATCMMYPSASSAEAAAHLAGIAALPQRIIPNALAVQGCLAKPEHASVRRGLGLDATRPLLVYVARFVAHKNHACAIAVADILAGLKLDIQLVLVGSHGECLDGLRERCRNRADVRILVALPDIMPLLMAADVFLFPSLEEGFGVVAIEAQAAGLPVIASDLPSIREALAPALHDFTFPANDAQAAARQVQRILQDAALRERLGQEGRAFAERFSVAASASALIDAYVNGVPPQLP